MSLVQPLSFNIVISKPHSIITWTIQDVLFDQIFLYFIEKIIKSFLAILKAVYSQLLDDLQQHLKWYYDLKAISFFSSDFESVFGNRPTGKILIFVFYPKAIYFECKFWVSRSAITHVQNWPVRHQRVGSRENDVIYSLA